MFNFFALTWFAVYASRCNGHVQTLRRLAQNREAARKSRLRKKVRASRQLMTYTKNGTKWMRKK
jgi:hypothetical protein